MVSTVFSKKQFSILSIDAKELLNLPQNRAKIRKHLILYPCINQQNVKNISDLIDAQTKRYLLAECKKEGVNGEKKLCVKNWTGRKMKGVLFIEHLYDDFFRIHTEEGTFMSNEFNLYVI